MKIKVATCKSVALMGLVVLCCFEKSVPAMAQENLQQVQRLLDEAEAIWKDRTYSSWSNERLRGGIKRIEALLPQLEALAKFDRSLTWRTTIEITLNNLQLRRNAYSLLLRHAKLPGNKAIIDSCLNKIDRYIADTTRAMFTGGADSKRQFVERAFLQRFADCLETIAEDSSAFVRASRFLKNVVLPPPAITEALKQNPGLLKVFLKNWQSLSDSTAFVVAQAMAEWMRADSLAAKKFWNTAISTENMSAAMRILQALLVQLQSSNSVAIWHEFIRQFPIDKVDKEFLRAFAQVAQRIQDKRWVITILDTLVKRAPEPILQKKEKVLQLYETLSGEKFQLERLVQFLQNVKALREMRSAKPPVMVIGDIFYPGRASNELPSPFYKRIYTYLDSAFKKNYRVIIDELKLTEGNIEDIIAAASKQRQFNFAAPPPIPDSLKGRPAMVLAGRYYFNESLGTVEVLCHLADAVDGIVLLTESGSFKVRNEKTYDAQMKAFAEKVAGALEDAFTNALTLENFLRDPLIWTPEKVKAAIFYGLSFGVQRSSSWDALPLRYIDKIQIKDPFWLPDPQSRYPGKILDRLSAEVKGSYPEEVMIKGNEEIAPPNAVVLFGSAARENKRHLEIFMTIRAEQKIDSPTDTLATIVLDFTRFDEAMMPSQVETAVNTIMINLEALIPRQRSINTTGPKLPPAKISKWQSVPSLFFAGTSQLIIANHLQSSASIKSQKRWGWLFVVAEAALLGSAYYFDQRAISNTDNKDLKTRNGLLIGAGILGGVSALKAWLNIGSHNGSIKRQPIR